MPQPHRPGQCAVLQQDADRRILPSWDLLGAIQATAGCAGLGFFPVLERLCDGWVLLHTGTDFFSLDFSSLFPHCFLQTMPAFVSTLYVCYCGWLVEYCPLLSLMLLRQARACSLHPAPCVPTALSGTPCTSWHSPSGWTRRTRCSGRTTAQRYGDPFVSSRSSAHVRPAWVACWYE